MASDNFSAVRRLHPSTIIFRIFALFRALVIPAIGVLFLSQGEQWEVWFAILIIPAIIFEVIRYIALRYRFERDELIITFSFIFSNERHIPFARIQNIDLKQSILHRLFNVAEVNIETGSGGKAEAQLRVVSLDRIEELRERIFAERREPAAASSSSSSTTTPTADASSTASTQVPAADGNAQAVTPAVTTLLRLTPGEIVRLGLIANRGLVLVAAAIGISWELNLWERTTFLQQAREWLDDQLAAPGLMLLVAGLGALINLYLLSIAWSFLRFYGFTLERRGDDLRLTTGLFTRHAATIPRRRIQLISIRRTPLHRLFRRATILVETAGGVQEGNEEQVFSRKHFVPLIHADHAEALLREIHPNFALQSPDWQPLAPRAGARRMRVQGALGLFTGLILTWWASTAFGWLIAAPIIVIIPALTIWHAHHSIRCTGWAMLDRGLAIRTGILSRRLTITTFEKIQTIEVLENPFDRRWKMASFTIDTAGAGPAGHRIALRYLTQPIAHHLRATTAARAESTGFHWN